MTSDRLMRAEEIVGHTFTDRSLLKAALTHPSYAAEHPGNLSYDRLEFLGDAVLGFLVSDELYRSLPDAPEGELTVRKHDVVSGSSLAEAAVTLGVSDLLLLGKGADAARERERASVLENTIEALIGALYCDGGLEAASRFALDLLSRRMDRPVAPCIDAKSALQQYTQAELGVLPEYRITAISGPPHERVFRAAVSVFGDVLGVGEGPSKQAAEKAAAAAALEAAASKEET